MPMRGRIELRAELVRGERVRGGFEASLLVGKRRVRRFVVEPAGALLEFGRRRKAVPNGRIRRQNMREGNEACARERVVPNAPQTGSQPFRLSACGFGQREGAGKGETGQLQQTAAIHGRSLKEGSVTWPALPPRVGILPQSPAGLRSFVVRKQ